MDIEKLQTLVRDFCEARDWDQFHTPKDLAIGLVTEASELIEHFRFQTEIQCREMLTDEKIREKIADELVDVLFFVLRFADRFQFDLTKEFARKMAKNAAKYPVDKARGSNEKYREL